VRITNTSESTESVTEETCDILIKTDCFPAEFPTCHISNEVGSVTARINLISDICRCGKETDCELTAFLLHIRGVLDSEVRT